MIRDTERMGEGPLVKKTNNIAEWKPHLSVKQPMVFLIEFVHYTYVLTLTTFIV